MTAPTEPLKLTLGEALVMVRDADEDCLKDGLPRWCTPAARARIDRAIAKAKGETP